MPQGICNRCGKKHYGWALQQPEHRVCDCGGEIQLTTNPTPATCCDKELDDLKAMRDAYRYS